MIKSVRVPARVKAGPTQSVPAAGFICGSRDPQGSCIAQLMSDASFKLLFYLSDDDDVGLIIIIVIIIALSCPTARGLLIFILLFLHKKKHKKKIK